MAKLENRTTTDTVSIRQPKKKLTKTIKTISKDNFLGFNTTHKRDKM